jgi:hypothetical protein
LVIYGQDSLRNIILFFLAKIQELHVCICE